VRHLEPMGMIRCRQVDPVEAAWFVLRDVVTLPEGSSTPPICGSPAPPRRFSGDQQVSALGTSNPLRPVEHNGRSPKQCLGLLNDDMPSCDGHRLTPRRTSATPCYRRFCGRRASRIPYIGTWGPCRCCGCGAPVWGDRIRCNVAARRQRHEAGRPSARTLFGDAHGKVATVEVGAVERRDRRVGAFL